MASKKTEPTSTSTTPTPRKSREVQPDIAMQIAESKQRISTLKTLNKLIPILEKMDEDGREQVCAWIAKHREAGQATSDVDSIRTVG